MNAVKHLFKNVFSPPILISVRCIREQPWKRHYLRRFGYEDPFFKRPDFLPRIKEDNKYSKKALSFIPEYRPIDQWSDKRKHFGENDYIDILGDGSIHPVKLLTNMPPWLRGFQGNEYQMLLVKQRAYSHWRWSKPKKWKDLNKRIMFLYRYLNRKTKDYN